MILGGFGDKEYTAVISAASSGANTLIAAPGAGKKIFIDFISFFPTSAVTTTFKSGSTAISGAYPLDAKQAITFENTPQLSHGVMECADNEAFVVTLGGAVQVDGFIRYRIDGM